MLPMKVCHEIRGSEFLNRVYHSKLLASLLNSILFQLDTHPENSSLIARKFGAKEGITVFPQGKENF